MAQVHLASDGNRIARELSCGEERQLEIAVALAGEPALLLLDEPTSGMSPGETARIIDLIAALPHSLTILMIEHDMKVVMGICERIVVLDRRSRHGPLLRQGFGDRDPGRNSSQRPRA